MIRQNRTAAKVAVPLHTPLNGPPLLVEVTVGDWPVRVSGVTYPPYARAMISSEDLASAEQQGAVQVEEN